MTHNNTELWLNCAGIFISISISFALQFQDKNIEESVRFFFVKNHKVNTVFSYNRVKYIKIYGQMILRYWRHRTVELGVKFIPQESYIV